MVLYFSGFVVGTLLIRMKCWTVGFSAYILKHFRTWGSGEPCGVGGVDFTDFGFIVFWFVRLTGLGFRV